MTEPIACCDQGCKSRCFCNLVVVPRPKLWQGFLILIGFTALCGCSARGYGQSAYRYVGRGGYGYSSQASCNCSYTGKVTGKAVPQAPSPQVPLPQPLIIAIS